MQIEENIGGEARTPKELFNMLEEVRPYTDDGFLRPATQQECPAGSNEGVYKVTNIPLLKPMPVWTWDELLAFAKIC